MKLSNIALIKTGYHLFYKTFHLATVQYLDFWRLNIHYDIARPFAISIKSTPTQLLQTVCLQRYESQPFVTVIEDYTRSFRKFLHSGTKIHVLSIIHFMYMFEPKEQNPNPDITQWNFTKLDAVLSPYNVSLVV